MYGDDYIMARKQFKAESKKLMDLMINSIYTNKEIFLRELISNASDAIDKLHYKSLTDDSIKVNKRDFAINISLDESNRTITISDNGIGMTESELESNLGTIAKSGSSAFKEENKPKKDIDIIGQFGVGFYSAFMVASNIKVISKAYGSDDAYEWVSSGVDGYSISKSTKDSYGTDIILTIKEDTEDNNYSEFLHEHMISSLITKYSNYITYPIKMTVHKRELKEGTKDEYEDKESLETINDMVPIWKRNKSKITDEEYNTFYSDKFFDYETPIARIHTSGEGLVSYNSLIYIPSHAPYDYYTKGYEKGLQLYSNGVLIMEKCGELLPDYYSFVKGVVDSPDLSLNISRETLQQDKSLSTIAKSLELKITKELTRIQSESREDYEKFFSAFGANIKFGIYDQFGMNKDKLKDLLIFKTSKNEQSKTLKEIASSLSDDEKSIYYVCGETTDKIDMLPEVENFKDKGYEILYCTDYMDEFVLQTIGEYDGKKLVNISKCDIDVSNEEEKKEIEEKNNNSKDLLEFMASNIDGVESVRFTNKLKNHPVCLSSTGDVTIEMEKVINAMPTDEKLNAKKVLEINANHKICEKLEDLYKNDQEELKKVCKILYDTSRLVSGLSIDNPTELTNLICEELTK
jgi:molecular chaperone HtpG